MDFARSTQAKSWLFDEQSLTACRQRAATFESSPRARPWEKVRKFASGFRHLHSKKASDQEQQTKSPADLPSSPELSVEDQEALVQFHSHQMQTLVGPTAILPELRTSETVHSTAITFLRRFYLSNSVVEFRPRRMAVACAFIAAKVEEERIHVSPESRISW
jgi:cyclin H